MIIKARAEPGNQRRSASVCVFVSAFSEWDVHSRNLVAFRKLTVPFLMIWLLTAVVSAVFLLVRQCIMFAWVYFPLEHSEFLQLLLIIGASTTQMRTVRICTFCLLVLMCILDCLPLTPPGSREFTLNNSLINWENKQHQIIFVGISIS